MKFVHGKIYQVVVVMALYFMRYSSQIVAQTQSFKNQNGWDV